jgi:hypothetical protein
MSDPLPTQSPMNARLSGHCQPDNPKTDLANYIRTASSNHAQPNAIEWSVGNWRAFADIPAKERQPDLICPLLPPAVSRPALKESPELLRKAASEPGVLMRVVHDYTSARPDGSAAETAEALSSAYCRAVVAENIPMVQSAAKIADFSQQVAIALVPASAPDAPPSASHR